MNEECLVELGVTSAQWEAIVMRNRGWVAAVLVLMSMKDSGVPLEAMTGQDKSRGRKILIAGVYDGGGSGRGCGGVSSGIFIS
jgi:hypothetical protein